MPRHLQRDSQNLKRRIRAKYSVVARRLKHLHTRKAREGEAMAPNAKERMGRLEAYASTLAHGGVPSALNTAHKKSGSRL